MNRETYDAILCLFFFFFNDTATTEIYTLSLHDALPIYLRAGLRRGRRRHRAAARLPRGPPRRGRRPAVGRAVLAHLPEGDRKSTRLNSSHANISYAVFCLKKKKNISSLLNTNICSTSWT